MAEPNPAIARALTAGEQTSEFQAKQSGTFWAKITMAAGLILGIVPQVLAAFQQTGVDQSKTGVAIASALGVLLGIAGLVVNGSVNKAYVSGRSTVKAAYLRDAEATVPSTPTTPPPL
jgi:predicted amino acid dehydrogenase